MEINNQKTVSIRVHVDFHKMIQEIKKHMKKYSYNILEVNDADASKLLHLKMEKFGGINKFLNSYKLVLTK